MQNDVVMRKMRRFNTYDALKAKRQSPGRLVLIDLIAHVVKSL